MADLITEKRGATLLVTLNRPEKRNALSFEMMELLERALLQAAEEEEIRAVVLTGAGDKSFCAGIDLGVLLEHLGSQPKGSRIRSVQAKVQALINRIEGLEKPVIAAIEGNCVGGGLEIAFGCDLRVSASTARFGFPETKMGMIPDLGGTVRMTRMVGPAVAKEWILTGRMYPAQRALELSLVTEVCEAGRAVERALGLAEELGRSAPLAIGWAKRVIDRSVGVPLVAALELEQDAMTELIPSEDLREGVVAFLEKRAPSYRGR